MQIHTSKWRVCLLPSSADDRHRPDFLLPNLSDRLSGFVHGGNSSVVDIKDLHRLSKCVESSKAVYRGHFLELVQVVFGTGLTGNYSMRAGSNYTDNSYRATHETHCFHFG